MSVRLSIARAFARAILDASAVDVDEGAQSLDSGDNPHRLHALRWQDHCRGRPDGEATRT